MCSIPDNLKRLVELFIERVVVGQDSIIIKFKFAREYHTGGLPPKTGQCRELQEKLLSEQSENAPRSEGGQNESQCVVKTTHWRGETVREVFEKTLRQYEKVV